MPWALPAAVNILSGVLMAALGALLLLANPRKDWNRLFALLAAFWGAQVIALNGVRVVDAEKAARVSAELGLAFVMPLYFFVVMFAAVFPRPRAPFGTTAWGVPLLLVPAIATLAVLFLRPELLLADVGAVPSGGYSVLWGPAFPYLVLAPLFASFFYALFVMMRRLREAETTIERKQITFVLAALAIYVAFTTPTQLVLFGGSAVGLPGAIEAPPGEARLIAGVMLVGTILLGILAYRLAQRARAGAAGEREEARIALAAVAGAVGLAVVADLARLELVGVVRLASVALIVYAIARYQLFDIDLKVKHGAAVSGAALAAGALAFGAFAAIRAYGAPLSWLVGAVALLAFVPLLRVATRVADRIVPHVSREGAHLYLRKLEVYRSGVESGAGEGSLAELRSKLGLTARDHDIVVNLALARAETASPAPDLRPGGVVFGKYAIDSVLAEGGYGRVFLARDRILERQVVVKELQARWRRDANVVRTFLREAQIAGRLNHPNIVSVLEVERHGEDHYIVMEHLPGGSLEDRLRGGTIPPDEAIRVARAILAALEAAHAQGVIHRDVKPANILFGARGEVKLTDFGIAQMDAEDPQRTISGLTTHGPTPGTLQYMSPEQAAGRPLDARSDIYAVGAVLHRMLTGRPHIHLAGLDELTARARLADASPLPPPANVPPALAVEVARALHSDPAERHARAQELADALQRAAHNRPLERA